MEAAVATTTDEAPRKRFFSHLYVQVLTAIFIGILLGYFYPSLAEQMKPLGDAFIKMIKMLIAPIIFCTVVHGIANMRDLKRVGRVGLKALIYFTPFYSKGLGDPLGTRRGARSMLSIRPRSSESVSGLRRIPGPAECCALRRLLPIAECRRR